jgi:hypothetical protein
MQTMLLKELFASQSSRSSAAKGDEFGCTSSSSEVSGRGHEMTASDMAIQNLQCRYHMAAPCDCDRYFARPGTAEYGC